MPAGSETRRFARAALKVASELDLVDSLLERFQLLEQIYRDHKAFRHLMITQRIPVEKKVEILRRIFTDHLTGLEYEILRLLLEKGQGLQLPRIARTLNRLAQVEGGRKNLIVYTPEVLAEKQIGQLAQRVEQSIKQPVRARGIVDPRLLGGIKLRLGNTLIDGTIARRLELLREQLV
ncbi:ATP synthase F1 subunit delta [Candidatus Neomarinimicrobiota bacterium]